MATSDPWADFRVGTSPFSPRTPTVTNLPQSPQQQAEEERRRREAQLREQGAANDATRVGISVRDEGRGVDNRRFEQADALRRQYDASPEVRAYRSALPQLMSGIKAPGDGTGDGALVYAWSRVMDPMGSVREGDVQVASAGSSWAQTQEAALRREFNLDGGGTLPPDIRDRLKRDMNQKAAEFGRSYVQQRQRFGDLATRAGLDPVDVIGPHDSEPFRDDYYRIMGDKVHRPGQQERQSGYLPTARQAEGPAPIPGLREPTQQEIFSGGVQWDIDQSGSQSSLAEYLSRNYGVDPGEEAEITAFWNKNVGNPDLTVENVREWYRRRGINITDTAAIAERVELAKKGGVTFTGSGTEDAERDYNQQLDQVLEQRGTNPETIGSSIGLNLPQGGAFGFMDEVSGVTGAAKAAGSLDNPFTAYTAERDLYRRAEERSEEAHPYYAAGSEIAGAVGTGGVGFARTARASSAAARAARLGNPARTARLGREAVRSSVLPGAATGAAYGFGTGEGPIGSPTNALLGAAGGAALAPLATMGGNALGKILPRRAPRTGETAADRLAAGQKFGLDMSLGDAGGMTAKAIERGLDVQPGSAGLMDAARQKLAGQIETAVDNVSGTFGPATSFRGMGEAGQAGARGWMTRFDKVTEKLYDAIPIKPTSGAALDNTRTALRELTDTFASNPELRAATENSQLLRYRQALESGNLSWEDTKAFRTMIGEQMGEALLSDGTRKGQLRHLYAALSADMEATARANGPRAYSAFRRANDTFAAGQERIEGAIKSLIGNAGDNNPEAAAALIQRVSREGRGSADLKALDNIRRSLRPEEWSQVSNAVIRLMGQPANSAGREFNPQTFIRVFDDMAPEAKNLLFGGQNKALRQNLDEFAGVMRDLAQNDATRNTSKTALGIGGTLSTNVGGLAGYSVGGLPGALLGIVMTYGTQYGAGKVWTNPAFVRWATGYSRMLKNAGRTGQVSRAANDNQMKMLSRLAAAHPVIAGEARELQQQLMTTFGQGPRPLAAQDEDPR